MASEIIKPRTDRVLHHIMSLVGGFIAGYAILRYGTMGNAQTINLIDFVLKLCGRNTAEALQRFGAFLVYFSASFLHTAISLRRAAVVKSLSLAIDAAAVVIAGLISDSCPIAVALYPFFFAMSFQWNSFASADGYVSSTIFSTNNTRQTAMALAEFVIGKDYSKLDKALFFAGSLLFFNSGVAVVYYLFQRFANCAIFFELPILAVAATVIFVQNMQKTVEK